MSDYGQYLEVAVKAATAAGEVIAAAFDKPKNIDYKGQVDLVTETDKQCEQLIRSTILAAYPTHKFIGEEDASTRDSPPELGDEPTWMVDPLDGTTNFVHGYPFACVSIGLAVGRRVVVGVVFNPTLKELFTASKGGGAFLNGKPIRVSQQSELQKALFATEIGATREVSTMEACFDRARTLTQHMRSMRCCGSCAMNLCGVACGRLDAFYEIGFGGCWDVAAGSLIVTEAGGQVLDPAGGEFGLMARRVLGANAHLGPHVARLLAAAKLGPKEPPPP